MRLYVVDGEDLTHRVGPFQTLIVLAPDNEPCVMCWGAMRKASGSIASS
jgi:hypothetical protein